MQNENKLGVMPIKKLIWDMSLPIIASMLVQALYNIVDSVFVSWVSEASLTAVSLAFPAQNLMISLSAGTAVGVNALMGRALGAKQQKRADTVAVNGLFLAFVGFLLCAVLGLSLSDLFFRSQTDVEEIVQMGNQYLHIVMGCSIGLFGQMMLERLLQGTGHSVLSMYTQGAGALINLILDPVFIFVFDLGVAGAAIATVTGQICACVFALVLNLKKNPEIHLVFRGFRPNWPIIGSIYAIGLPSVVMMAIGSVMTFLMNKILITYHSARETAATAFGIYFKLNSFVFMPVFGLNNGVIPIIAYNYGARDHQAQRPVRLLRDDSGYGHLPDRTRYAAEDIQGHGHHDGRGNPGSADHLPELLSGRGLHRSGRQLSGAGQVHILPHRVLHPAACAADPGGLCSGSNRPQLRQRQSGVVVLPHCGDILPGCDAPVLPPLVPHPHLQAASQRVRENVTSC